MSSGFKITLEGLSQVEKLLKDFPKKIEQRIANELNEMGDDVVRDAVALAPTDEGHLRSSISHTRATPQNLEIEIVVATDYAAYLEFGTKKYAAKYVSSLPADWQTFAAQYRGKGSGNLEEMIESLVRWVRIKGISGQYSYVTKKPKRLGSKKTKDAEDYNMAYVIAIRILQNGIKPQPFLKPALDHNMPLLIDRLKLNIKNKP